MAKAKIINVVETPQNRFLSRQNRLMKGAVIETSLGKAKITNRPTQEGQVNAILITESK
jgi:small subunit ribosomal protein S8e